MTKNLLKELFEFIDLTHKFQQVERVIDLPNSNHRENDAEHSYQLTMVAWYLVTKHKLQLDLTLVIKYALIHDLVEAYAGDSFIYDGDPDREKKKKVKEEIAMKKLEENFPDFRDLHHLIKSYEKKTYQEAKFIWALDKMIPIWNIYLDNGRSWHKENISLKMLIENKTSKVKASDIVNDYFQETIKLLEEREEELFPKK